MNKKVLIICTSPRKGGNSEILAEHFAEGAKQANNSVEIITLFDKKIEFCKGCLACQKINKCVINDDVKYIIEKMHSADIIAFATPIYFYEMRGQMKTLLDRTNPLFGTDYKFRDIYMLSAAADNDENAADIAQNGLQGWVDCYAKAKLAGSVLATGVADIKDINGNVALNKAYEMGKSI